MPLKTLVQAFISCRLDCCNSLLYDISDGLLQRLKSVQNAAARLVTGASRRDHITQVLRQLHWLPVPQRVAFKIAGLVHQSLVVIAAAPAYLADDCHLLSDAGSRALRYHSLVKFLTDTCHLAGMSVLPRDADHDIVALVATDREPMS